MILTGLLLAGGLFVPCAAAAPHDAQNAAASGRDTLAATSPAQAAERTLRPAKQGSQDDRDPACSVHEVQEFLQYPAGIPAGCETTSLTLALCSLGFETTPHEMVTDYTPTDPTWSDPTYYFGSPYDSGGAFPLSVVCNANSFLQVHGTAVRATDASGTPFSSLLALAHRGSPVLVWTTAYFGEPVFSGDHLGEYAWYTNEHCVLLYDVEGNEALVSDPLQGLVRIDAQELGRLYEACGSYAVRFVE